MSKIAELMTAADNALQDGGFVKLSLGHYTGAEADLKTLIARMAVIRREEMLSITYRYKTRDIVKNFAIAEGLDMLGNALQGDFNTATLFTTAFDLHFERQNSGRETLKKNPATQKDAPPASHDRSKKRLVGTEGKHWLHALNITDESGEVYKNAQDKYRQIHKYVEIISGLVKTVPPEKLRHVADMGSGKGYLTFALYDYLRNTLKFETEVTGVEYRADLVNLCNAIARDSGFEGLNFIEGSILDYRADRIDMLIALHACDTATDDAIARGIKAGAELIVVAPCCHKQIRGEMGQHKKPGPLGFLLKHGIFVERQAEMVTDGLRALILEYFGYSTKVFEFIGGEHTPKNVMIVAVKNPKARDKDPVILAKINEAKDFFGIARHYLEKAAGI